MSTSITILHKRSEIDTLPPKERKELLDQLIDAELELSHNEIKLLNKEQLQKYTNKGFEAMCWLSPEEWKMPDETQKELYAYNRQRAAFTPELFDSMSKEWRKNILMAVNVLSGYFLNKEDFERLSNSEKKYYVNKKLIKTSSFYPWEIPFLTLANLKKVIDQKLLRNDAEDFISEQLKEFSPEAMAYYKKQKIKSMKINESVRKYIRSIINEVVSDPGTVFGPYHDEITISKEKVKPQYFVVAINRAPKICSNPEISNQELSCPINYEIEKTIHSAERQFRHVNTTIEDEQINALINRGINKLVKLILQKTLVVGDKVHLKDKRSDLNVVIGIELEKEDNNETTLRFPIITVMNNKKFYTGFDTKGPVEI